jgi:N,N'-diacetylbacillosaminyl-diphospho-undecaprenol alpha-1,3-N-acetylgalactosaminyltransferase
MKKARIVFLSHLDRNLYRFRLPLMQLLVEQGCEVYALCPEGGFSGRFADVGVRHVGYRIERSGLNPFREAAVVASLSRTLRRIKPDLMHSFTMKPNIYGALAARAAGVGKIVASVTGLGSFYVGPPSSMSAACFRWGLDRFYAFAMRRVDRVIFQNTDDLDELVRLGVCRASQCVLIPGSGVDTLRFAPAEKAGGKPVVVTMAARLIRDKGVEEFLAAAERLKERFGDGVVFQLAGEEDKGNPWAADRARLSSCAERGVIRLLGYVADMPGLLRDTDIYALPSYYREGIPVSVLEAMSAGLPVVTTNAIGCRETVVDEQSGLLVPVKDAAALASALERLIVDPQLRQRFGRAARRRAEEVFSIERIGAAHLEVYRALLPGLL